MLEHMATSTQTSSTSTSTKYYITEYHNYSLPVKILIGLSYAGRHSPGPQTVLLSINRLKLNVSQRTNLILTDFEQH